MALCCWLLNPVNIKAHLYRCVGCLRPYRVLVLHQVPQQSVPLLTDVVQVDVGHSVAAGVLVLMDGRTYRDGGRSRHRFVFRIQHKHIEPTVTACLTLHQVLVVDGGQVGQVLLEVGAELSVRVDLDQLLLAARLLAVEVGHVLLRLGADLRAAAAHVVSAQHVLHHGADGGGWRDGSIKDQTTTEQCWFTLF